MAEGQIKTEPSKEPSCLPVTKDAVQRALREIADDPTRVMLEESEILARNPELQSLIFASIKTYGVHEGPFLEGALFTHRIIRTQADIPIVSTQDKAIYLKDSIDDLESINKTDPKGTMDALVTNRAKQLGQEDPELDRGLQELFKYRDGKTHLYAGAIATYFPIKQIVQGIELARKLGF